MKIGIIVHSYTGNTLLVAEKIKKELLKKGNEVEIQKVEAEDENPELALKATLKTIPSIKNYDALIFGAPVRAFSLSPIMQKYLNTLENIKNIKIACFVTQQFPFAFLGGNNSIKQMINIINKKEGKVVATGIANWAKKKRDIKILEVVQNITKVI